MSNERFPYAVVAPVSDWFEAAEYGHYKVISRHKYLQTAVKSDHKMQMQTRRANGGNPNFYLNQRVWRLHSESGCYEPLGEYELSKLRIIEYSLEYGKYA